MYSNRFDISELFPKFPKYFRIENSGVAAGSIYELIV